MWFECYWFEIGNMQRNLNKGQSEFKEIFLLYILQWIASAILLFRHCKGYFYLLLFFLSFLSWNYNLRTMIVEESFCDFTNLRWSLYDKLYYEAVIIYKTVMLRPWIIAGVTWINVRYWCHFILLHYVGWVELQI